MMDEGRWRGRARIVAILDLILSVIVICFTIAIAVFSISSTTAPVEDRLCHPSSIALWISTGIVTIFSVTQVWASFKLFHSTAKTYNAAESLKISLIWCTMTFIYLMVVVNFGIVTGNYISLAVNLVIRGAFLSVVYKFTRELGDGDDDIQARIVTW